MDPLLAIVAASCCIIAPVGVAVAWLLGMGRQGSRHAEPEGESVKDVAQREVE